MPIRARATRLPLRAAASLVASAFFALAAAVTVGVEPSAPAPIPDAAFGPVVLLSAQDSVPNVAAASDVPAVADGFVVPPSPPLERAQPSLPAPRAVTVPVAPPKPVTTHRISGAASWYCRASTSPCTTGYPDDGGVDAYAAAGPRLRAALGSSWRGRIVYVDGMRVQLIDWCQCHAGESNEKLLDLYYDVYARVGGSVTIRW